MLKKNRTIVTANERKKKRERKSDVIPNGILVLDTCFTTFSN